MKNAFRVRLREHVEDLIADLDDALAREPLGCAM